MKYLFFVVLTCLSLVILAHAQTENDSEASTPAYRLGVQAFSGFDVPALQQDVGSGPMYGLAVRGNVWHFVHGELFFRSTSQGDVDETLDFSGMPTETITYKGGSLTGLGLNILLAHRLPSNIWPYGLIGLSTNSLKPGDSFKKDDSLLGWSFGGGTGINLYNRALYLDVNTSLLVMPFHDNKASRKDWQSRLGIQYFVPLGQK